MISPDGEASRTFRSASLPPGVNSTRRTAVASFGMPGTTRSPAGSAAAVSQSPPVLSSRACTAAPSRPLRTPTCTVRSVSFASLSVDSRRESLACGGTVMPSPTVDLRAPSFPYSSMSTTAAESSGLVRCT